MAIVCTYTCSGNSCFYPYQTLHINCSVSNFTVVFLSLIIPHQFYRVYLVMSYHASVTNLDTRSQKSWHKIRLAFEELVLSKRYDAITTSEIIERAGVARSTFYEHFLNKEDILGKSLYPPLMVLAKSVNEDSSEESLRQILNHFWEHRSFCRLILTGAARKSVNNILIDALNEKIIDNLKNSNRKLIISTHHAAAQIAASQLTLMEMWLLGQAKSSDENLAFTMKKTSLGLFNALVQEDI